MRILRWLMAIAIPMESLAPTAALANGGAYIELNGTHFLAGDAAVAEAYFSVPKTKRELLERGPFFAYVLPAGAQIREGRPIPSDATRVGAFEIEREKGDAFEARVAFTVPSLPGDFYSMALCNDPCTISGFGEPVGGTLSIVETAREAQLLTERARLQSRTYVLRRQIRKAERQNEELGSQIMGLEDARRQVLELTTEIATLERQLRDARAEASAADESSIVGVVPGAGIAIGLAALVLVLFLLQRRPTRAGPHGAR